MAALILRFKRLSRSMFGRSFLATLILFGCNAKSSAEPFDWLRRLILDRIQVSGYRDLGFHLHSVTGDREAFNTLNYYGQGNRRFTDIGNLEIVGDKVLDIFNFRATISDSRFVDPQQQQFRLDYAKSGWRTSLGDIWGSLLNSNPYATISRSMRGVTLEYRKGPLAAKVLRSEAKGSARTVSIQGNNSAGPYYLQSNQIVADSEQVQLDGIDMQVGRDYIVNYEVGYITFVSRLISPTSTIVVTYEALGTNSSPGVLQGAGLTYSFGPYGTLGLTALSQASRSGSGLSTRLETFQGFGAPSTPYFLQFEPLRSRPIIIKADGILQVEGVDYHFDLTNPAIFYFNRTMPATSNIDVVYTPKPTQTVDGDRKVIGLDYRVPIGHYGSVLFSQATGELSSDVNPLKGTARGISGNLNLGGYRLSGGVSDVPDTYVSVETRGFQRNERSTRLSLDKEGKVNFGGTYLNSRVALRSTSTSGAVTFQPARTTSAKAFVGGKAGEETTWNLEQSRQTSQTVLTKSQLDSTRITSTHRKGSLDLSGGLERESGFGEDASSRTNLQLNSAFLNADYRVARGLTLGSRTTFSNIKADSQQGNGRDITLTANYRPSDRLQVDASWVDSDSGKVATLNQFQLGSGLGYDGNGFSGGGSNGFNNGAIRQQIGSIRTQYRVSPRISLDTRLYQTRSSGSVTSNAESTAISAGASVDLGNRTNLYLSLDQSKTKFLDSSNKSEALSFDVYLDAAPVGPWTYRLGTNVLLSGGSSSFAQDSMYFDATVGYRLSRRQQLVLSAQTGRTTGYLPQTDSLLALTYQYQIYENIALAGSFRLRKLSSLATSTGSYTSRSFDLNLTFNFGR